MPEAGWPRLVQGQGQLAHRAAGPVCPRAGPACPPGIEGSEPAVVTTPEALVAPEAAATETAVAEATATKATVAEAATETTATETAVAEATAAETAAAAETTAEAVAAAAAAAPRRRCDVHWTDYGRYRRRRGGVGCRGSTEKHCAGHRACADCAGGDAAGRRE